VLIVNISKKEREKGEQRDKGEGDSLTGVGAKPGNALSIASPGFSFGRDVTQHVEMLTLINSEISEPWQLVTRINCYGYKQYAGVFVSLPCLLCHYYPVSYA
jgi:hypothetical protein